MIPAAAVPAVWSAEIKISLDTHTDVCNTATTTDFGKVPVNGKIFSLTTSEPPMNFGLPLITGQRLAISKSLTATCPYLIISPSLAKSSEADLWPSSLMLRVISVVRLLKDEEKGQVAFSSWGLVEHRDPNPVGLRLWSEAQVFDVLSSFMIILILPSLH